MDNTSNILLKFKQSTDSIPFGWVRSYVFISDGKYTNPQNDNYTSKPILDNLINNLPIEFALNQNYPNPFNPSTNIQFDLPKDVFVSIKVYDIIGREVAVLLNDFRQAGRYITAFNGSNLASGIYYYTIKAGNFEQTKRMVLVK